MTLGEATGYSGGHSGERPCPECGKLFKPKDPRHRICYDCFKNKGNVRRNEGKASPSRDSFDEIQARFERYLQGLQSAGYFNEKGHLRTELLVEDAEWVAKRMVNAHVTMGQLRKFFTMTRGLEQQLVTNPDFDAIVPEIASLHKFAVAVVGRADRENRANLAVLREFIDANAVRARQSRKDFLKGFIPHFESVIAYFTFHNNESKGD